jgi:CRP-like cAMP-binding protein
MFDSLYKYIKNRSQLQLSEQDKALITDRFKPKKIRKRQYFLQEENVCTHVAFIVKGAMRMFSTDGKGNENVHSLGIENWWMVDHISFQQGVPSAYNIEAIEDTEMLIITHTDMEFLISSVPAIAATIHAMDVAHAAANQKRMHAAYNLSAIERYEELLQNNRTFIDRFPQGMIASYLGISPATLSRLLSEFNKAISERDQSLNSPELI